MNERKTGKRNEVLIWDSKESLWRVIFAFYHPSIIAQWYSSSLYHGRWYLVVKRVVGSGTDSGEYLHAVYNRTVSVSILFAVGNSTIVAIFLGQGEKQKANEVFTQNVVLLCILSVLITILVMIFLDPFARFLGATDHILPYARTYIGTIAPFL